MLFYGDQGSNKLRKQLQQLTKHGLQTLTNANCAENYTTNTQNFYATTIEKKKTIPRLQTLHCDFHPVPPVISFI